MRLTWRHWASLAANEATRQGKAAGAKPIPAKHLKAIKASKKLRNPHTDGPHSSN